MQLLLIQMAIGMQQRFNSVDDVHCKSLFIVKFKLSHPEDIDCATCLTFRNAMASGPYL